MSISFSFAPARRCCGHRINTKFSLGCPLFAAQLAAIEFCSSLKGSARSTRKYHKEKVQFIYLRFLLQFLSYSVFFSFYFFISLLVLAGKSFRPRSQSRSMAAAAILIHIYGLCGWRLLPFQVCVQCTCQSLIEGKIAV